MLLYHRAGEELGYEFRHAFVRAGCSKLSLRRHTPVIVQLARLMLRAAAKRKRRKWGC